MDEVIRQRSQNELVVFLEEECGYRYWIWFPELQLMELIDWWKDQENISNFAVGLNHPYNLPGNVYLAESDEAVNFWFDSFRSPRFCKAFINSEFDSYLITTARQLVVDRAFPEDRLLDAAARLSKYFG